LFWGATDPEKKLFRGVLTLATIFMIIVTLSSTCNGQDMWYSREASVNGPQWVVGGTNYKPMRAIRWNWNGQCHCESCNVGVGDYFSIEFNTLIANPTIYPAIVDTTDKGYAWDECHYHFHSHLIQHTLYNTDGAVVAGGAKMGYDWVSAGTFNPDSGTNVWNEIRSIDPLWIYQDIPETLPQYGQFVISGMRDDLYGRGFDGNRIILGHFIYGSYVGVKDGTYRLHSRAYFENLDLDEGANIYPNEWNIWIKIENDTVVTLDVPEPVMPVPAPPTNVEVMYSKKTGDNPYITWEASAYAVSYELERTISKGNDTKQLETWITSGTGLLDLGIIAAKESFASLIGSQPNGWKAIYRVRAINASGASEWVSINPKWVNL